MVSRNLQPLAVLMTVILLEKTTILFFANAEISAPIQCIQYTNATEDLDQFETSLIKTKLISTSLCAQKQPTYVWYRFSYPLYVPFSFDSTIGVEFLDSPEKMSCSKNDTPEHPCRVHETIKSKLCFHVNDEISIGRAVNITHCGSFYSYQLLQFPCKVDTPDLQRWIKTVLPNRTCKVITKGNVRQKRNSNLGDVSCDTGWKPFAKSCYIISSVQRSWHNARKDCESRGAHLLKIGDENEQRYITNLLRNMSSVGKSYAFWIGLNDPTYSRKWQWESDGSHINYTNWNKGEPNGHKRNERCVEIYSGGSSAGNWNDHYCSKIRNYICEKKVPKLITTTTTTTTDPITTEPSIVQPTTPKRMPTIHKLENQIDDLKANKNMSRQDREEKAQKIIDELTSFTDFRRMNETERKESIDSKDLTSTVRILEKIVDLNVTAGNLKLLGPANNILDSRNVKSWRNLTNDTVTNDLVTTLEKYGFQYGDYLKNNSNTTAIIEYPNLQLHVSNIKEHSEFSIKEGLSMFPNASFNLSSDALSNTSGTIVVVMWYKTLHRFISNSFNGSPIYGEVNSEIITASVQPQPSKHFDEPVTITWNSMDLNHSECVYWKPTLNENKWKKDGCRIKKVKSDKHRLTCECDHLTAFALIDVSRNLKLDGHEKQALELISTIGCSLSLVAIFLTILTYALLWRKLHKNAKSNIPSQVLMHLCVAIGMTDIFAILAGPARNNETYCTAVSILLYFFILAVFGWMLCEGFVIYLQLVNVYSSLGLGGRHLKCFYLIGWGIPVAIVAVLVGANDRNDFITERACWCAGGSAIFWTFVATIGLVLMINIVIFILALRNALGSRYLSITSTANTLEGGTTTDEILRKVKVGLRGSAVLLPLLGLTWVFGLLVFNRDTIVFKYLFAIFNSLQGVMIFVFHVYFNRKVHEAFREERKARRKARNIDKVLVSSNECSTLPTFETSPGKSSSAGTPTRSRQNDSQASPVKSNYRAMKNIKNIIFKKYQNNRNWSEEDGEEYIEMAKV